MQEIANTIPDISEKGKLNIQLSNRALQERIRPYAQKAIDRLAELLESKQETVAVSAAKTLLAKVLPDLKSVDLGSEEGIKFLIQIVQDNKLKDANAKDTTPDQELSRTGTDLQVIDAVQDSQ